MAAKSTIEQLLAVVRAGPTDMRTRLKLADLYAKAGDIPNSVSTYEEVATYYADAGFTLKAASVYKHMCSLILTRAPELRHRYRHVPLLLSKLFSALGVETLAASALQVLAVDAPDDKRRWS